MRVTAKKGDIAYLKQQKTWTTIRTIIYFAIVLAVFFAGFLTTKTRNNVMTVVAILGVLPASKSAVSMIMFLKAKQIKDEIYQQLKQFEAHAQMLYNMIISSESKTYQMDCIAIYDRSVFVLCTNPKLDTTAFQKHLKNILANNGKGNVTIKVYDDVKTFTERLTSVQKVEKDDLSDKFEAKIKEIICNISM